MSVKSSIKSITKSLESIQDDRTYLIKHTRDAVSLCSQSIIAVHGQDLPTAKKKAAKLHVLLKNTGQRLLDHFQNISPCPSKNIQRPWQ